MKQLGLFNGGGSGEEETDEGQAPYESTLDDLS